MQLKSELYIAASIEAKELYQKDLPKKGFFNCKAVTLDQFLRDCNSSYEVQDDLICRVYFKQSVISLLGKFKHFQFTKANLYEDSIDLMYDFYAKVKLNDVNLDDFFTGEKKEDIQNIFAAYESIKQSATIFDWSDYLLLLDEKIIEDQLKQYDSVLVDWQFYDTDNISFLRSDREVELFKSIEGFEHYNQKLTKEKRQALKPTENITLNKVFDFSDEAQEAVKIAKTLLLHTDNKPDDIAIVATKIDDYKESIRMALKEYGLKGYITTGFDFVNSAVYHELKKLTSPKEFIQYTKNAQTKLANLPEEFKQEYISTLNTGLKLAKQAFAIVEKLKKQNIKTTFDEIYEELALKTTVVFGDKKDALVVTEHNQVLKTKYKHIIYLGIDSTHLPQKFYDNFLFSSEDSDRLHISNYYKDSLSIYDRLKGNIQNLHLITAKYLNKKELQISSVITDYLDKELPAFAISDAISTLNDLLEEGEQNMCDEGTQEFIKSKQIKKEDEYNGVLNLPSEEKKFTFSASRLNEYSGCPMRYYFNYILKAKSPQEHSDDELNPAEAGTLFHEVVEKFANRYNEDRSLDVEKTVQQIFEASYCASLPKKNDKPYETVLHKVKKSDLQVALNRFIKYVNDGELKDFYQAEEKFDFTMDGTQFTGFIDRVDINEDEKTVTLIDYKTSQADKNTKNNDSKYQKLTEYKEFQLPLYHFFVDQDETYKKYQSGKSYLLTFIDKSKDVATFNHAKFGQTDSSLKENDEKNKIFAFTDDAKGHFRNTIKTIADHITKGDFYSTPSQDACVYCQYFTMCGDGVKKEKKF